MLLDKLKQIFLFNSSRYWLSKEIADFASTVPNGAMVLDAGAGMDPQDRKIIADIRKHKLTYLSGSKLASIVHVCHAIERDGLPGIFIEVGCALGGSAILTMPS